MIFGIDLGSDCGYSVFDLSTNKLIAYGTLELNENKHQGGGWRFLTFEILLNAMIEKYQPKAIGYELVRRHVGTEAAHVYGGLLATLQVACEKKSIPYTGYDVKAIKKAFTGNGNAKKDLMTSTANTKYSLNLNPEKDHDAADAIAIGEQLVNEIGALNARASKI